jgi:hypothetical protein
MLSRNSLKIKRGRLKVIPCANPGGFQKNLRWRGWFGDLNRIFDQDDAQAEEIIRFFSDCDIVLDFHEAWGWHLIDPNSTGNTLVPIGCNGLAEKIVTVLNELPSQREVNKTDPRKRFSTGEEYIICKFSGTLSCWMHNHGRKYILIEIAGQNDIQPLGLRCELVRTIIFETLKHEEM